MNKKEKAESLQSLSATLTASPISLFAAFSGVSSPDLFEAKKKIKAEKVVFKVVKKSLLKKALENMGIEAKSPNFWKGEVGLLTVANGDFIKATKLLADWSEQNKKVAIKGGFLLEGKQWLDQETVKKYAKLPGLQEVRGSLVGILVAPLAAQVGVLQAVVTQVVLVLQAIADQQKKSTAGAQN